MPKEYLDNYINNITFHKINFRFLVFIAAIQLIIIFLLITKIFIWQLTIPTVPYFVTTNSGHLVEIKPDLSP